MTGDIQVYRVARTTMGQLMDERSSTSIRKYLSTSAELVALAPLELRDAVSIAVHRKNRELEEAGSPIRYYYDVVAGPMVFHTPEEIRL